MDVNTVVMVAVVGDGGDDGGDGHTGRIPNSFRFCVINVDKVLE
jgi:hypothetical protein